MQAKQIANRVSFVLITLVVALLATGGTYALWNTQTVINGGTLSTGNISLTVNGSTSNTISGLDATKLRPGGAVTSAATLANAGSVRMDVRIASVTMGAVTNALDSHLSLRATVVGSAGACAPGLTGQLGLLNGYSTSGSFVTIDPGTSAILCLELVLASNAPASVQGGTASFTVNFSGDQKAKS